MTATLPTTRAGYVTLVGRPNAGKSTLMNALVGEKLSIVTPRAQTTWERVTGLRTEGDTQMVFLDTPGLLEVRDLHQRAMLGAAHHALVEADVVLLLVDATRPLEEARREVVRDALALSRAPLLGAINKIDAASAERVDEARRWIEDELGGQAFSISALTKQGLAPLLAAIEERLPASGFLYDADDLATQPVRFFVAEMIRETVFERFDEEIPYSVAVRIEEFRENEDPVYIGATLLVERESQKAILVGHRGAAIREVGIATRAKIESFLGRRVYLDLWVKPLKGWRRKRTHLERLGYHVPDEDR